MIEKWTIRGKHAGPRGLILGGVHGDEYEPIASIRRLYQQIDSESLSGELVLVPVVNEPAYQRLSRTGPDGLDLARTFPGNSSGSITEQIAAEVTPWIQSADFLIDLHTGGRCLEIFPLSGYVLHENPSVLETQRQMAQAFNLPIIWGTSPLLQGRTLSVARDAGVPAIYAEWGGGAACNPRGVEDYVQGCLNVLAQWKMLPSSFAILQNRVQYFVEDSRPESGHLQLNYQAPVAGFYEPVSELGQQVQAGDLLGRIWRRPDEPVVEVLAQQPGLLFLKRLVPAISAGDCLATVLESTAVDSEVRQFQKNMSQGSIV